MVLYTVKKVHGKGKSLPGTFFYSVAFLSVQQIRPMGGGEIIPIFFFKYLVANALFWILFYFAYTGTGTDAGTLSLCLLGGCMWVWVELCWRDCVEELKSADEFVPFPPMDTEQSTLSSKLSSPAVVPVRYRYTFLPIEAAFAFACTRSSFYYAIHK